MDEFVRWIGEQLDEDQRHAEGGSLRAVLPPDFEGLTREGIVHLTEPVKARVLCEIEAKRLLIKTWESMLDVGPDIEGGYTKPCRAALAAQARNFLIVLSLPYADRPGYAEALATFE